jgi:hypothetical protein
VQAAVTALETGRWADLLALVPQEAVQRLRDTYLPRLIESETLSAPTAEEHMAAQPWLPREVAAYYAEPEQRHIAAGLPAMRAEWGVSSSFRELEALSPAEFFVRYLSASSPAAKLRAAMAVSPKPPADPAGVLRQEIAPKIIVLGEVREGSRHAHVLYRQLNEPNEVYDPESPGGHVRTTQVDYAEGRWWLRLDHTLVDPQGWLMVWGPDDSDSGQAEE